MVSGDAETNAPKSPKKREKVINGKKGRVKMNVGEDLRVEKVLYFMGKSLVG